MICHIKTNSRKQWDYTISKLLEYGFLWHGNGEFRTPRTIWLRYPGYWHISVDTAQKYLCGHVCTPNTTRYTLEELLNLPRRIPSQKGG